MTRRHTRPFIALVAAYALALQAIFAGMVLGARSGEAALFASAAFCLTGEPQQGDQQPSDRMPCCIIAACCPAASDAAAQPVCAPALALPAGHAIVRDGAVFVAPRIVRQDPHQPRAPPAA